MSLDVPETLAEVRRSRSSDRSAVQPPKGSGGMKFEFRDKRTNQTIDGDALALADEEAGLSEAYTSGCWR